MSNPEEYQLAVIEKENSAEDPAGQNNDLATTALKSSVEIGNLNDQSIETQPNEMELSDETKLEIERLEQELSELESDPKRIAQAKAAFDEFNDFMHNRSKYEENSALMSHLQVSLDGSQKRIDQITDLQNQIYRLKNPNLFQE